MVAFAKEGYAGLAIGNRSGTDLYSTLDTKATIEGYSNYVVDLRRGLDLLETLPQIDAKRIGFVGHSLGCAAGSILSGIETRIGAYALMACGGYITDPAWSYCGTDACFSATDDDRSKYQERLAVLNPVNYIGRGGGAAFLVQASRTDQIALESNVVALYDAAPQPKNLTWYQRDSSAMQDMGGHNLGCVTFGSCDPALPAFADHRAWLMEHV
jgi:cephalosporin-C deacetylase-like acetyl esterase